MNHAPTVDVVVTRGGVEESAHRVSAAVVDASGRLHRALRDPDRVVFARSAVKVLQALPLVEDGAADAAGVGPDELALCCASHNGEPAHVAVATRLLERGGFTESALACGPHPPLDRHAARALRQDGREPTRLHNNCSGKHGGMLLLARHHGWDAAGYHRAGHPVQDRMLAEMARWSGLSAGAIPGAVDGCGVVTFALPLRRLAGALARFGGAAAAGSQGPARLQAAVAAHPFLVAGTGRLCTRLMEVTGGRVAAKVGAEGVYVAWVPAAGLGLALKVEDGATRAAEPALLALLEDLGLLRAEEVTALAPFARGEVVNTRGEVVGSVQRRETAS